jgi:23S rRNA pseudouridine2605 synthase
MRKKVEKKGRNDNKTSFKGKKNKFENKNPSRYKTRKPKVKSVPPKTDGTMRLNKYLAHAGIASRREADELIKIGAVMVNGEIVTEMGFKVKPTDKVQFNGETIKPEKKVYVLLNKPKNFITTTEDDKGRRTVMELVEKSSPVRLYPVGRLDRNTTGVLLFTNDGDLAKKLTHPKHMVEKIYHVKLDKSLKSNDMEKIRAGFKLEDGYVEVDDIQYIKGASHSEIGVKIHSGRNRIVRRIFEHFNYNVIKLDRVLFAGLTKKDLKRGHWRHLTKKEVDFLMML